VNRAVFYDSSILSLFLPVRKKLLIGLGLVSELNLSELKAVLAHEFGHFSQRTMTLGSYVYIAQQLVSEIVHGRDGWDDILRGWRQQDIRIAVFAGSSTGSSGSCGRCSGSRSRASRSFTLGSRDRWSSSGSRGGARRRQRRHRPRALPRVVRRSVHGAGRFAT